MQNKHSFEVRAHNDTHCVTKINSSLTIINSNFFSHKEKNLVVLFVGEFLKTFPCYFITFQLTPANFFGSSLWCNCLTTSSTAAPTFKAYSLANTKTLSPATNKIKICYIFLINLLHNVINLWKNLKIIKSVKFDNFSRRNCNCSMSLHEKII